MTLIIAEVGVNHNGDLSNAFKLIEGAADSGANIVKFQTFKAEALVTKTAKKANYQINNTDKNESHFKMIKNLELSEDDHFLLIEHCKKCNIEFLSSAFDLNSLSFLAELGLSRFKVPSGEITNLPYLRQIGGYRKPIILSTGMSDMNDIKLALEAIEKSGTPRSLVTILHCSTEYPTLMKDVNLNAMQTIKKEFGVSVGYSDHTSGIEVSIAAAALGAKVIEKHITLDKSMLGPDHSASIELKEFSEMVLSIRNIEEALGNGNKIPTAKEVLNKSIARKSLVASRYITKGEVFTNENISIKRPGSGISPMKIDSLIGEIAFKDFQPDELICKEN